MSSRSRVTRRPDSSLRSCSAFSSLPSCCDRTSETCSFEVNSRPCSSARASFPLASSISTSRSWICTRCASTSWLRSCSTSCSLCVFASSFNRSASMLSLFSRTSTHNRDSSASAARRPCSCDLAAEANVCPFPMATARSSRKRPISACNESASCSAIESRCCICSIVCLWSSCRSISCSSWRWFISRIRSWHAANCASSWADLTSAPSRPDSTAPCTSR
mmetsp:Transcript_70265/g.196611  ORF Transcript_70265/g.196611 Transcript_70265/m.196611 type:complete len:220 (-) Transcript_70265:178-837(-)